MSVTEIILERQSANDETAVVASIFVESGTFVKHDDLLFEIENSKAVEEYRAPVAGFVEHQLQHGKILSFGTSIATIAPAGHQRSERPTDLDHVLLDRPTGAVAGTVHIGTSNNGYHSNGAGLSHSKVATPPEDHAQSDSASITPLASAAAKMLMDEHKLSIEAFTSRLITSADVLHYIKAHFSPVVEHATPMPKTASVGVHTVVGHAVQDTMQEGGVSKRKAAEIDALSQGPANGTLSVLGVKIGVVHVSRPAGDMLTGLITDLVIYEASRLMREHPLLNGYFTGGRIVRYPEVSGGLAMDRGGQLVVYGIQDSGRISLPVLRAEMESAVSRYMDDRLTSAEMQRATFTVSDLSSSEIDFMFPLLPKGQSLILGVTRDDSGAFSLFAGFDHRVTEGLEVSRFLAELRARLQSFDEQPALTAAELRCYYCHDSLQDAQARSKQRGLLKLTVSSTEEVLCCGSCWNGW